MASAALLWNIWYWHLFFAHTLSLGDKDNLFLQPLPRNSRMCDILALSCVMRASVRALSYGFAVNLTPSSSVRARSAVSRGIRASVILLADLIRQGTRSSSCSLLVGSQQRRCPSSAASPWCRIAAWCTGITRSSRPRCALW
ncbi:hypothetical protein DE146DRAFT_258607 [Phaeosphaeria sp. MPI-PUGE-AT-0046c]|nr:hypothetical protein DE146DRAFT_258607 [Phaeosphaeria sp. MPI-PUGE-AT-0046c]